MSTMWLFSVLAGFFMLNVLTTALPGNQECDNHCYPGASCWPGIDEELELFKNIKGDVLTAYNEEYRREVLMVNTRVTEFPFLVVMAETVDDVIYAVKYANRHNMKITIRSSGHDYIGRSTWHGSLQINLSRMKGLNFNLNSTRHQEGEVTAQSGNSWLRLYNETNKLGRVIVGGSAHTVSMGGYTLGGGHSPIGRKFGMAVDNLLEVEMVTSNGSLVYANISGTVLVDTETGTTHTTTDTDIFWAVRGGGGSTYGIVTAFTYKLHNDSKMVKVTCYSPIYNALGQDVGRPIIQAFDNLASTTLAPEWGGYEIITSSGDPKAGTEGTVLLVLNHFGEWGSPSFNTLGPFIPIAEKHCAFQNMSNFLEYEIESKDALFYRTYVYNTLLQPNSFTPEYYNFMYRMFNEPNVARLQAGVGCTGTLIGGNMKIKDPDSTAVNPNFRTGVYSMSCGMSWSDAFMDKAVVDQAIQFTKGFVKHGNGTYFNEPSAYLPNWKTAYWGGHYDRLLAIKQRWDPQNVFTCLHCVGSNDTKGHTADPHIPDIHIPSIVG
ncbi:uncharacterized protein LOC123560760 [Mercenaria mercenaria]|uniref:uncharacterized protein LOC123560760 n=1 Tax=Mercenaria mercenaria TaxID=6596 RepID=UPI00234EFD42|nr:uncharacterized protein LOC123560760 [Mercenaria mercenaria]